MANGTFKDRAPGDAQALIEFVRDKLTPLPVSVPAVDGMPDGGAERSVIALPAGYGLHNLKPYLDQWRARPERREGTARLEDLDSLIAHVNRFKDSASVLFGHVDRAQPRLLAVLDYHQGTDTDDTGAGPRWCRHRALYEFPLSEAWRAWLEHNGEGMAQPDFAEFLEDRMVDVIEPPANIARLDGEPAAADAGGDFGELTADERLALVVRKLGGQVATPHRLLELSRGLAIHASDTVVNALRLQSGEGEVSWKAEHRDAAGQALKVPGLFLIALPIFWNGAPYRVLVRLRYRLKGPVLVWTYHLHDVDRALDHAVREACARAAEETTLPLWYGKPETVAARAAGE